VTFKLTVEPPGHRHTAGNLKFMTLAALASLSDRDSVPEHLRLRIFTGYRDCRVLTVNLSRVSGLPVTQSESMRLPGWPAWAGCHPGRAPGALWHSGFR
jgi:hypothetical protein